MLLSAGTDELLRRVREGQALACARLMSWAERGDPRFVALHADIGCELGAARRLGVSGPPGAGKSTLVAALTKHWRAADAGRTFGIVTVDPSSPFSGGALLGDRVRMGELSLDPGVFIRSMATRGAFGGLAGATDDLLDVLDLAGRHTLLVETVGVGQSEVEVARSVDLTVVVLQPGGGDTIQAMKAGLMEVADLYVLNKADLQGADRLQQQLRDALSLRDLPPGEQQPPMLVTTASTGGGLGELARALDGLWEGAQADGRLARRRLENLRRRVRRLVDDRLARDLWQGSGLARQLDQRLARDGTLSAHALAAEVLSGWQRQSRADRQT